MEEVIAKGAEAWLVKTTWMGEPAVIKRRVPKKYRIPELDLAIRSRRTVREARLMRAAKRAGVPCPVVYCVDPVECEIVMEFVEGGLLRLVLNEENAEEACHQVGRMAGRLHSAGIVHGDLTTSNVISGRKGLVLIDFGLGSFSDSLEDRGVDAHLFKRAVESAHFRIKDLCLEAFWRGYEEVVGVDERRKVERKVAEIEARGRYVRRGK